MMSRSSIGGKQSPRDFFARFASAYTHTHHVKGPEQQAASQGAPVTGQDHKDLPHD